jgi:hypothetical protein
MNGAGMRSFRHLATVRSIVAAAIFFALPAAAHATTANDLCLPSADPCVVSTTVNVTSGSIIDVGARTLEIANNGALSVGSGTMTLHSGPLNVDLGGKLLARGTTMAPGGIITATATSIAINGSIQADGTDGGAVMLTGTGSVTIAGPLDVHSPSTTGSGGSLTVQGTDVSITASGSLDARGGADGTGGDIAVLAFGALTINGGVDATGGSFDGGTVSLTASTTITVAATVTVAADGGAAAGDGGGNGGDIQLTAGGAATVNGKLTAVGGNDVSGGGDGGIISVEGSSVSITPSTARLTVAGGNPGGFAGEIDLISDTGAIDMLGQLLANGASMGSSGGTISIIAAGTATLGGTINGSGDSGGGGDFEVASGGDLTVASGSAFTVAAMSNGLGGSMSLTAGAALTVSGSLVADGGSIGSGGSIDLTGCTVQISTSGSLSSLRTGGTNTLIGRNMTIIQGSAVLNADPASGQNAIRFADPAHMPSISGSALINPAPTLVQDATVMPCIVSGHINYYAGTGPTPVPDVTVDLASSTPQSTSTDPNGLFSFSSIAPGMISMQPRKNGDFNFSVTALDGAHVLQFIAGLRSFSPDQLLAADVTGNGTVSPLDGARILQYVAGLKHCSVASAITCTSDMGCPMGQTCTARFPVALACGSDWLFRPVASPAPNQTLVQPQISTGMCQQGAINYSAAPSLSGQDFIAILFGDTTGNWHP